jgi:hypothetical protein
MCLPDTRLEIENKKEEKMLDKQVHGLHCVLVPKCSPGEQMGPVTRMHTIEKGRGGSPEYVSQI